ncbi:MAG TPA: hypothetical protein VE262_10355 [Blastocatellia bacterium]|nr:hypothetical protein [Blastocatellia bacterium]
MGARKLERQAKTVRERVEVKARDKFWSRAFRTEWEHQFPDRSLTPDGEGRFLIDAEWLPDLEAVASQTCCRVVRAPANPNRRQWISGLVSKRGRG